MNVIWKKVWFDLWRHRVRTILAVLSIAAGVFAIGAMFGMCDQLITTMDESHHEAVAPDMNIHLASVIDREMALNLRHLPGVEDVQPYNEISIRYKLNPQGQWKDGILYMLDDFEKQKYEIITLRAGEWPRRNQIGIERMAAQYLNLGVGDSVIIKLNDEERTYPISGLIRHPFVPPPQFEDLMFFFIDGQGLERFGIPQGKFRTIYVRVTPYSLDHAKEVATEIKDYLGRQNIGIAATVYQDPDKHWGRSMMDGVVLVLKVLAVLSLLMSVVLVYNTMSALITHETDQIGVLKAIGGRTHTILMVYLSGALAYGLMALCIALPLGALVAFSMSQTFLNMFNIDYSVFRVSSSTLAIQIAAAVIVPLIAGAIPALQGASITARQAFAAYGLEDAAHSSRIDRIVERIGRAWLPTRWATVVGNMFRRRRRLVLTSAVLVMAGVMFLSVMSLSSSIDWTLQGIYADQRYDVTLSFAMPQHVERIEEMVRSVDGVAAVETRFTHSASLLAAGQLVKEAGIGTSVEGVPDGSDFYLPMMVAGRWLTPGDGQVVILPRGTADKNNIRIGDSIVLDMGELGKSYWQVVGLYEPVFAGVYNTETVYAPQSALFESTKLFEQGQLLHIRTRRADEPSVNAVTAALKDQFEKRKIALVSSQTKYELESQQAFQFSSTTGMLVGLAMIIAVVGGISLMGALSISVVERTKEIGVLRAIGARSRTILGMFLLEGVLQGVLSWLIAVPLAFLIAKPFADGLGHAMFSAALDYQFNGRAVITWLILILILSGLASILPARKAAQIRVRESLAYA